MWFAELIPHFLPKKVVVLYFAPDFKRHFKMDNSESGDDLGNNFLTVETQSYMVQGEDLDGKVMFIRNESSLSCYQILHKNLYLTVTVSLNC